MGSVTTECTTAGAVVEEPMVPAQPSRSDEQLVTAEAIAEALDPALVAGWRRRPGRRGCSCWAAVGCCSS
jgi:hypothetical protein